MAPIGTSNFLQRPRWHRRPLHSLLSSPAVTPFHGFPTDQEHMRSAAAVGATPPPSSLPRGREETKEVESKKQSSALDTGEGGRVEGFKSREKIWGRPHRSVGGSHPHSDLVPPIGPSPPFTVAQVDLKIPNTDISQTDNGSNHHQPAAVRWTPLSAHGKVDGTKSNVDRREGWQRVGDTCPYPTTQRPTTIVGTSRSNWSCSDSDYRTRVRLWLHSNPSPDTCPGIDVERHRPDVD
ncbi:hypothetical protein GW17_00025511 [Ensete ventricosum]|nr:hypothetical protein GW17_00025511 [Ensete ventricosum]